MGSGLAHSDRSDELLQKLRKTPEKMNTDHQRPQPEGTNKQQYEIILKSHPHWRRSQIRQNEYLAVT